jgi:hypothetical protein
VQRTEIDVDQRAGMKVPAATSKSTCLTPQPQGARTLPHGSALAGTAGSRVSDRALELARPSAMRERRYCRLAAAFAHDHRFRRPPGGKGKKAEGEGNPGSDDEEGGEGIRLTVGRVVDALLQRSTAHPALR